MQGDHVDGPESADAQQSDRATRPSAVLTIWANTAAVTGASWPAQPRCPGGQVHGPSTPIEVRF